MRIIGGKYKGRPISPPSGLPVRPTPDQAKEGLFNILHHRFGIEDARVLDLFCGTGNISYEFLSRGSGPVIAVDQDKGCTDFTKSMLEKLGEKESRCIKMEISRFLKTAKGEFDIIFMDPPYAMPNQPELVDLCFRRELLAKGGWLILEHSNKENFSMVQHFSEMRPYGGTCFSFFTWGEAQEEEEGME